METPKPIKIISWIAIIFSLLVIFSELFLFFTHNPEAANYAYKAVEFFLLGTSAYRFGRQDKNAYYIFNVAVLLCFGWITGAIIALLIWFFAVKKHYQNFTGFSK
jgi:hypothetical protein